MKRIFAILLGLSFFTTGVNAQEKEYKLAWNEKKPLSWKDFQGEPNHRISYDASTNSGMSYSWSLSTSAKGKNEFVYEVKSNFYPNLSWVKEKEKNDHLLAHEQLHFDISELHARKLRKAMLEYCLGKDIKMDLRDIYHRIESDRQRMQEQYDAESRHSLDRENEAKWQEFVKLELRKLQAYAS